MSRLLYSGAGSRRVARASLLQLYWRASDGEINALTGQTGRLELIGAPATRPAQWHTSFGTNGVGDATPRFGTYMSLGGKTLLAVSGEGAGGVSIEQWSIEYPRYLDTLTFWARLTPEWVAGANRAAFNVAQFGVDQVAAAGGGFLRLQRTGVNWVALRDRLTVSQSVTLAENAAITYPMDVLMSQSAAGVIALSLRSASGTIYTGTPTAGDASFLTGTDRWGVNATADTQRLYLGPNPSASVLWEAIKVASGVKTFAEMDALA
jgi:hypothetical protein